MHPSLQRDEHAVHGNTEAVKIAADKLEHDRRSADNSISMFRIYGNIGEKIRNHSFFPFPSSISVFNNGMQRNMVYLFPFVELIGKEKLRRLFCTVQYMNMKKPLPMLVNPVKRGAQWRNTEPSGNKQNMVSGHFIHWKCRSERPPYGNMCSFANSEKRGSDMASLTDTKLNKFMITVRT